MRRTLLNKLLSCSCAALTPLDVFYSFPLKYRQSLSLQRLYLCRSASQSITHFSELDSSLRKSLSPLLRKLDDDSWTQLPANQKISEKLKMYRGKLAEIEELQSLKSDNADSKMLKLIEEEQAANEQNLVEMESEIAALLIPVDPADHSNVSIEISAGVGGAEAMLFTRDLFNMYFAYAQYKGWNVEVALLDETELGGLRKANILVDGHLAYRQYKFEGGVHRVQRIPKTEKSGRIHTSTATVAILPQPSEIDVVIHPKDLQMQTFRSSGPGGQHVNKTESAVRLIHVPSGIIAECQATRSQLKNRETALRVIRSRLYEQKLQKQTEAIRTQRKIQVGSAGRSEKIRTYNYQQDRITDHRLGSNAHNISAFLSGSDLLDTMITELQQESDRELLTEALAALK